MRNRSQFLLIIVDASYMAEIVANNGDGVISRFRGEIYGKVVEIHAITP